MSPQDLLSSHFLPSLFHLPGLSRVLVMANTSPRDVLLGLRCPKPLKIPWLAQDAPRTRPPCSDSPAVWEAKIRVSLRGKQSDATSLIPLPMGEGR